MYGSAAKTNLEEIEKPNKEDFTQISLKRDDSVGYMFDDNKFLTVSYLCKMGLLRGVFRQLRRDSLLHLLTGVDECSYYTRSQHGLLIVTHSRIETESKSVENRLWKAFNWLKDRELISKEIKLLRNLQLTLQLGKIWELFVIDSNVSTSIFNMFS